MLTLKEAPYFLTLLFSLLGLTVKYLSHTILTDSFIEYDTEFSSQHDQKYYDCVLSNVSNKRSYSNLEFKISIGDTSGGHFINAYMKPSAPIYLNDIKSTDQAGNYANFTIRKMIPNSRYTLRVRYVGEVEPIFAFDPEKTTESINLKESSMITWIAKNEFEILFFLIAFWSALIITYLLWLQRKK